MMTLMMIDSTTVHQALRYVSMPRIQKGEMLGLTIPVFPFVIQLHSVILFPDIIHRLTSV
jgi:hypothetical protein